ncbi:MAG: RNA polymerase sigma factor [Clostridiales bacterium]|nr:RNA polymerase sigma factor [Clostridiales bacterium]
MQLPEIQKYTEYLFRVALKKCGNLTDAEDLTQEVLLAALQYPREISDIKSWLSMVLNHKYYDMLRRRYKLPTVSIDLIPEEAEPWETPETNDRPNAVSVRREVAYLADKYRTVIVRHYLNGEKVQDIADSLGVPKGTVLSRLSGGREQMRRGFDEMESCEKQSFQPEKLEISCNGCSGFRGEPWSLVANDLMKQNILIVAYPEPLTVVEIARALGIPTAYVESAVCDLTESELMKQVGNKYFTYFMITKPEKLLKGLEAEIALAETHYPEILKNINEYLNDLRAQGFLSQLTEAKRKKLEYYLILHLGTSSYFV